MTIYAVGDIHGQSARLDRALDMIEADGGPEARIVFLGDYTDRGPDSRGVLDRLIAGRDAGRDWIFLKGNHDRMFLRFLEEGRENDHNIRSGLSWFNPRLGGVQTLGSYGMAASEGPAFLMDANGGLETLASYGIGDRELTLHELAEEAARTVPQAHQDFLASLQLYHATEELLFVHAGIRPGLPLERQVEDDLIWIRDGFLDDSSDHGRLVVHGHTVVPEPMHLGNRVALDTGAGYGDPLTAAVFEGGDVWVLGSGGRVPLVPVG
ncbi:metallophosphoesterase family protein [Tranquillimonas alkanivorans]|uniref:Serine/threonine protein phosphatase 1 n=1 Tax=Tranquillimonas alkanivorans TaxID=441119 RepID=A0A1I5L174_9RHOB|nr:metallophosphoesterase family protein [Tranquillimonas alkanivorans]SFO90892.1 serine/threonine protein phosphatase 1 [Tranquillimonas alkanivorans]